MVGADYTSLVKKKTHNRKSAGKEHAGHDQVYLSVQAPMLATTTAHSGGTVAHF